MNILKSKIFKFPNKRYKINELPFGSKIKVTESKEKFLRFAKGWIRKDDVKPIAYKQKPFKKYLFLKILNINGVENLLKE